MPGIDVGLAQFGQEDMPSLEPVKEADGDRGALLGSK
jgi:hypothetical protein